MTAPAAARAAVAAPRVWRPIPADRSLTRLAPAMAAAIVAAEAACRESGLLVLRFETSRSRARQEWLYAQGREVRPPERIVTKASSALRSWHGYGLAVDFIHPKLHWGAPEQWWQDVAAIVTPHGLAWGGDWPTLPDVPHYQWARCSIAPRVADRTDYARGDLAAVWARYGADIAPGTQVAA
ncbi:M15 family metallopeptidase [Pseudogemmatithrix spongiicola]|uniref:M15 family metallopeptidase n=1 Tax=Pseudogemmatithrix spongiicola TaxID=3062599 RepID=A0AA49JZB5_9BACT|nr:M15 family metallopeptidase [Gemmatimonadaceae bacterium 'strain 138']WKW14721.1 M15 family metallopeptidase [Gemmatimonadaceae bacterium 'strain 318']